MAERTVLSRMQALGYSWTRAEQHRWLFRVCLEVAKAGVEEYGVTGYHPSSIAMYPEGEEFWVDAVIKEIVCTISTA